MSRSSGRARNELAPTCAIRMARRAQDRRPESVLQGCLCCERCEVNYKQQCLTNSSRLRHAGGRRPLRARSEALPRARDAPGRGYRTLSQRRQPWCRPAQRRAIPFLFVALPNVTRQLPTDTQCFCSCSTTYRVPTTFLVAPSAWRSCCVGTRSPSVSPWGAGVAAPSRPSYMVYLPRHRDSVSTSEPLFWRRCVASESRCNHTRGEMKTGNTTRALRVAAQAYDAGRAAVASQWGVANAWAAGRTPSPTARLTSARPARRRQGSVSHSG